MDSIAIHFMGTSPYKIENIAFIVCFGCKAI